MENLVKIAYNNKNIKKIKGKLVILNYTNKHLNINELSGVITASTRKHILFLVNNDSKSNEILIGYDKINDIKIPCKIKN